MNSNLHSCPSHFFPGKSGCRRIVPGQYLAVDPKGRAIMTAAVEKQKLVYIMNRDVSTRLTISSPLEAHKSHTIVTAITALDVLLSGPIPQYSSPSWYSIISMRYSRESLLVILSPLACTSTPFAYTNHTPQSMLGGV